MTAARLLVFPRCRSASPSSRPPSGATAVSAVAGRRPVVPFPVQADGPFPGQPGLGQPGLGQQGPRQLAPRQLAPGRLGRARCRAGPGRRRQAARRRVQGRARLAQAHVLATIRLARPRPAWAQLAAVRDLGSQARLARLTGLGTLARPVPAKAAAAAVGRVLRLDPEARGRPDRARWAAGQAQGAQATVAVLAARVLAVRGRARAACRLGRSRLAAVPAADQAVLALAPGPAVAGVVLAPVAVVDPAVAAVRVPRAPVVAAAVVERLARVRADAAGAARRAPSGVRAGGRPVAGSRRSSDVKSSTTCKRRRLAVCPYRAATARSSGSRGARR